MKTFENRYAWTSDRDARLRSLWDEGLTGSQIAQDLRTSRSAVLARARRIRLASRVSIETKASTRKPRKKPNITKFNFASGRQAGREPLATIAKEPYVYRETVVTPEDQRLSFEALEAFDRRCRYAHGDEHPYTFCGAKTIGGTSWCEKHLEVVSGVPRPKVYAENVNVEAVTKRNELEGAL